MAAELQGAMPDTAVAPPVADNGSGNPAGIVPAPSNAETTAIRFGGLRGGKKRKDGLVPGSPEAAEADRKRDRERKASKRALACGKEPLPLPPAVPGAENPDNTQPATLDGNAPATGNPPVPWNPKALEPLFEQIIVTAEELSVSQLSSRALKGGLPGPVVKDIETEAAWHPVSKQALQLAAPQVAAKYLNKTGISAEYQPEVTLAGALIAIAAGHVRLMQRLDKLIAVNLNRPGQEETKP